MSTIATAAFGVIGSVIGAFAASMRASVTASAPTLSVGLRPQRDRCWGVMPEDKKQEAFNMLKEYAPTPPSA